MRGELSIIGGLDNFKFMNLIGLSNKQQCQNAGLLGYLTEITNWCDILGRTSSFQVVMGYTVVVHSTSEVIC